MFEGGWGAFAPIYYLTSFSMLLLSCAYATHLSYVRQALKCCDYFPIFKNNYGFALQMMIFEGPVTLIWIAAIYT